MSRMRVIDATIRNEGSVVLIDPHTSDAREWIDEHVASDAQWFGNALVVEPRYVGDIVTGMVNDGLEVE